MFRRMLQAPIKQKQSFFLFGPRCTGKTFFIRQHFPKSLYIDLLDSVVYSRLLASPGDLESMIPQGYDDWFIIDEVQRVPSLLNEVHRLIENKGFKFILTGSSARKLRQKGVNLLAGRALTYFMHPLTVQEADSKFVLHEALQYGMLPPVFIADSPKDFLSSYVHTYLREEVLQESLTRNIDAFSRFLEIAAFSQGAVLNKLSIARETYIKRTTISNYFEILKDLLISYELPVFNKRSKRKTVQHVKFYFFDVGLYQAVRPKGILDKPAEVEGSALETLFLQSLRAVNDYLALDYQLFYWRTRSGLEVDFVVYGKRGLHAFEIKRSVRITKKDIQGLLAFKEEYAMANLYIVYGGNMAYSFHNVQVLPVEEALRSLPALLR